MTGSASSSPTPDQLRAEIDKTRHDLGQTVDQLTTKLDVKAQAKQRIGSVKSTLTDKANQARHAAPAPVQKALDQAGTAAAPAVNKAAEYKKQIMLGAGAALLLLLLVRRRRSS
jgi:Protein of unknown function (DUF3618)